MASPAVRILWRWPSLARVLIATALAGGTMAHGEASWHFVFNGGVPVELRWNTASGQNYDLFTSPDMKEWSHVEGFPQTGSGGLMAHTFTTGQRGFFRIIPTAAPTGEFVYLPAGEFQMGNANGEPGLYDEEPVHNVSLNAFLVAKFEVTKALWDEVQAWGLNHGYLDLPLGCVDSNGTDYSKSPHHPVFNVSWSQAVKWCNARSEREGLTPCYYQNTSRTVVHRTGQIDLTTAMVDWSANGYRLPTEAEWEMAARGGLSGKRYPWGDTISHTNANYNGHPTYNGSMAPVGSFPPNGFGLHDVIGNVAEFCWDRYSDTYYNKTNTLPPVLDPRGTEPQVDPVDRVSRGGSATSDFVARTAARTNTHIGYSDPHNGLRLVRAVPDEILVKIDNSEPSIPLPYPGPTVPTFSFLMGRTAGDAMADAPPVQVRVRFYQLGKYEVTKGLWDRVRTWASTHGYTDLPAGGGKGPNHPVHSITWYDMVKWCNARSQRDALTPCYKVGSAIYQTGTSDAVICDWNANGYRLPTEAEWEAAARGGETGRRYPWGDTITHSQANYTSNDFFSYDISPTRGRHPDYQAGGPPYTAPIGSFAPNDYGLHDMAGNVWEWCWDWYQSDYYSTGSIDPRGPATGVNRISRGGGWSFYADLCRAANRDRNLPGDSFNGHGFRLARSIGTAP